MKISFIFQNIFIIVKFNLIHNLEPSYWEERIVHIDERIYYPDYQYDYHCDNNNYSYRFIKYGVIAIYDNYIKFNIFAPIFNYTCFYKAQPYHPYSTIEVLTQINFVIKEIPPIRECEMTHDSSSQISWIHIYVMNIVIFCMFIGVCLLIAFLVTDVVMRNSNQSNVLEILGFDKSWGIRNMIVPAIIVVDKGDSRDRFYKLVELSRTADKNMHKLRYTSRPTDANFKYLLNLVNERANRKSIKIKLDIDVENNKNEKKYRDTKRDIILQELEKNRNARNEVKLTLAGITPKKPPVPTILKIKMSKEELHKQIKDGNAKLSVPNVLNRTVSKDEFHKQIKEGNSNLTRRMKGSIADLSGFERTTHSKSHTIALSMPRNTVKGSPPDIHKNFKNTFLKQRYLTEEIKFKLQTRNSSTKDTSDASYKNKSISEVEDRRENFEFNSTVRFDW